MGSLDSSRGNDSKNERDRLLINGIEYSHVKNRLTGGAIYTNQDKSVYVKTGRRSDVLKEMAISKDLLKRGFQVPRIIDEGGTLPSGEWFYIEESIGDRIFGDIFKEETIANGQVGEDSLNDFVTVIENYCRAQFDPTNHLPPDRAALDKMAALDNVMIYNPPSETTRVAFATAYGQAAEKVQRIPWGYVQSDLNVFNMLRGGVIDFELADHGPIGYDTISCLYFGRMWPAKQVAYHMTDDQIKRCVAAIDAEAVKHGLSPLSDLSEEFLVIKSIWGTAKKKKSSQEDPEKYKDFWTWRVKVRDWCIERYLKGKKIDSNLFDDIGSS
ncbi:phosphotransferase [Candidatus Kaiserbacteria bacterium]|nr:phosphotransferase [Candidatus Kaiserbacteria bacterium]